MPSSKVWASLTKSRGSALQEAYRGVSQVWLYNSSKLGQTTLAAMHMLHHSNGHAAGC